MMPMAIPRKRRAKRKARENDKDYKAARDSGTLVSILRDLRQVSTDLARTAGIQVSSGSLREKIKNLVKTYFIYLQPTIQSIGLSTTEMDNEMQQLMQLANSHTSVSVYKRTVDGLREKLELVEVSPQYIKADHNMGMFGQNTLSVEAQRVIDTLEKAVPSAALSYKQAVADMNQDRFSYRGTAAELREVLREVLDYLAPDQEVKRISGYKQEPGTSGPTMRQKVHFVLKNRGTSNTTMETPEAAASVVDEAVSKVVRATYNRGSMTTHASGAKSEIQQIKMYLDTVLFELLEIHKGNV